MKDAEDIRAIGNELIEAADQLEFERSLVAEAVKILKSVKKHCHFDGYDATIADFLRRYENREAIYASRKLAEMACSG